MKISAVIIVKNGEATIGRTLESLADFDDVVVLDTGSTDRTRDIAAKFPNVNLVEGNFDGFGATKNRAAALARHEWILIVDDDEVLDAELRATLLGLAPDERVVFRLNFKSYYKDIEVKHCGWGNQKIKRLYNRRLTGYNSNGVHEDIVTEGFELRTLSGNVHHFSYQTLSDFIRKADLYSSLFAEHNAGHRPSSPAKAFFNALYSFFRTYVIRQGFRDGYVGLVIAYSHMLTNFFKYMKLYEANLKLKKKGSDRSDSDRRA